MSPGTIRAMDRAWVTQCALSRICGVCARPLGRPIAFVGTAEEIGRNAFHYPPLHVDCAPSLIAGSPLKESTELITTAGFEFVRPAKQDVDRRPTFQPNSIL
jgi:hypothetical protein